jgi:hypothetical protein
MKCITFDKEAQAAIPKNIRELMDDDREKAITLKRRLKTKQEGNLINPHPQ